MKLSRLMRLIDDHKLTVSCMRLFFLVAEEHPVPVDQAQVPQYLSTLGMNSSTIARHFKRLQRVGWLQKSKVNHKSFQIELTNSGLQLWKQFEHYDGSNNNHRDINNDLAGFRDRKTMP